MGWFLFIMGSIATAMVFKVRRNARPKFIVQIGSASGETKALESEDEAHIRKIVNAMNEAIIHKG